MLLLLFLGLCGGRLVSHEWVVKYTVTAPDGFPRRVIGVRPLQQDTFGERVFPGPLIEAHVGDTVQVNVHNLLSEPTTLHFHGLRMRNNLWQDGAYGITEAGIPP